MVTRKFIVIFLLTTASVLLGAKKSEPVGKAATEVTAKADALQKKSEYINVEPLRSPDTTRIVALANDDEKASNQAPQVKENNNQSSPNQVNGQTRVISTQKNQKWIWESSIRNAPDLFKGIASYLLLRLDDVKQSPQSISVPSFHRFILVGPPGTGKTTLAYALGYMLHLPVVFVPATGLLGKFRNDTAVNIKNFLHQQAADGAKKIIVIDELHKLFEYHTSEHTDSSQSAAAFWLALDHIEKYYPNVIIIGTANSVDKLPPEIKSRFAGKVIAIPLPEKNQKIQAFKDSITYDQSVVIDASVNDKFIAKVIQQLNNGSLRDVQLIIDTAKMFYYAENLGCQTSRIVLTRMHFEQAIKQLQAESCVLQESTSDALHAQLQKWGVVFSVAANIAVLARTSGHICEKVLPLVKNLFIVHKN